MIDATATKPTSAAAPPTRSWRWPSARYWVAAALLAAVAMGVRMMPSVGVFLRKDAVQLKRSLTAFDCRLLAPRYEKHPYAAERLSEDHIESLGTREYLELYLGDTQRARFDTARVARVFITYYTGHPDMVPHVPEECFIAGGYEALGGETRRIPVRGFGPAPIEAPVRILRFKAPADKGVRLEGDETVVLYFFSANGAFLATRDEVRLRLSNPFERQAYYAKIEISFLDEPLKRAADSAASLAALPDLLSAVLPQLLREHVDLTPFPRAVVPAP